MNHLCELRLLDKFPISDDHLRMKIKQQEVTEMLSRSELITIFKTSACLVTAPTSQFTFKCILTAKILKQGKKKIQVCVLRFWLCGMLLRFKNLFSNLDNA